MKKTKFVTAIYSDLFGTDLGGRPRRREHYRYSLRSLLKMTDAEFVCYTSASEIDSLKQFFYEDNHISTEKITFKVYDLRNFEFTNKLNAVKDLSVIKSGDRCYEIQYSKFIWCKNEIDFDYDFIYWIDAGLSHGGLIPDRYRCMTFGGIIPDRYRCMSLKSDTEVMYECSVFNNNFLKNLLTFSEGKIFNIAKDNVRHYWAATVPGSYYKKHCQDLHIIGGLFGGNTHVMKEYVDLCINYAHKVLGDGYLYCEESIMSLTYYNHQELFKLKFFDQWWHEDYIVAGFDAVEYCRLHKPFYKVIEELNDV